MQVAEVLRLLATRLHVGWTAEYKAVAHHRETVDPAARQAVALAGSAPQGRLHQREWQAALEAEAKRLDHAYEETFPGWRSPDGMSMKMPEALDTMRKLGFPP